MSSLLDEIERPEADEWNVPEGYELVDGHLVEMPMGAESGLVAGELYRKLGAFCDAQGVGKAIPGDIGFRCFPHRPRLLRKPDGSFFRRDRLPGNRVPSGDLTIALDLAIESVSPSDLAEDLMEKVDDYLAAGVQLVWVIYPIGRRAVAFGPYGFSQWIGEAGELDGRDVVPGFRCKLADILQPPEPPAAGPVGTGG